MLYVISGNQSSVAMISVFAFIVSAFLHIPLKQLALAIALRRMVAQVAQSCDAGCRDRGWEVLAEERVGGAYVPKVVFCPCLCQAACHSWRKKRRSTKRYRRDCEVICRTPVLLAHRRARIKNTNIHFSLLLSSSVFLCEILDKVWVIMMWEKSY